MKVRNILIGLLVVLMAFVFISCEDEPEEVVPTPQPGPAPVDDNTIAKITATAGIDGSVWKNEKFSLQWDLKKAFGEETEGIKNGSVLTLQFRTSRDIHMIDLRTNKKGVINKETDADDGIDTRWLYEEGSLDKLDSLELGEDGWYTLKYTFTEEFMSKTAPDYDKYYYTNLLMNFAGYLMEGDVLEVKNAFLDGQALPLTETEDNKILYSTSTSTMETVTAHDWAIAKTYAVVYALGGEWRSDAGVPVEAVAAGGKATGVPATNGFTASYALGEEAFDLNTAINSDLILSYTLTPVQWTVTFDTLGGSEMEPKQVTHGTKLSLTNEELPTYPTYELLGWFLDSDCTQAFDLATETITGNITLYAGWAQNLRHVTIDLDNAEGTDDVSVKNVVDGGTVTASWFDEPYYPGFYFAGWFVGEDAFDPATPITADITVTAHWTAPTKLYSIVATNGDGGNDYDKFRLNWDDSSTIAVNKGDVLTFQYRTTVPFTKLNIRTEKPGPEEQAKGKWVYEADMSAFESHYTHVAGADGWISVMYVFPEKFASAQGNYFDDGTVINYPRKFIFDLISKSIRPDDILEIKGLALNNDAIALENVAKCATIADPSVEEVYKDLYVWSSHNVTFDYDGSTKDVPVEYGLKVAAQTDTAKDGQAFVGWYSDAECTIPFDFDSRITANITVYGKWIDAFMVTLNKNNGMDPEAVPVTKNAPMTEPTQIGNPGKQFGGWYTDSGLTIAWNFANDVEGNMNLYAKWDDPTTNYRLTATAALERFAVRYYSDKDGKVQIAPQKGDVIAFKYKPTKATNHLILRNGSGSSSYKFAYYDSISAWTTGPDGDGWYTFYFEYDKLRDNSNPSYPVNGVRLEMFTDDETYAEGDYIDIVGFTFNGQPIVISGSDNEQGAYGSISVSPL